MRNVPEAEDHLPQCRIPNWICQRYFIISLIETISGVRFCGLTNEADAAGSFLRVPNSEVAIRHSQLLPIRRFRHRVILKNSSEIRRAVSWK
jgi:hypothetical protein